MATTSHVSRRSLLTAASATLAGTAMAATPLAFAKVSTPDPVFAALAAYRSTHGLNPEAWFDVIETRPTTQAGLLALVRFLSEHRETFDYESSSGTAIKTVADALEAITHREGV
ncbi:hypothetical protein KBI52_10865 [Microvirga sp. HBU67558]|uniref:hypothetical protein n=1 Tax=Microvirga sp. HBU67558 TaxID=2824562 RepID=UPI001B363EF7|nr:hypothetical protein [Microvirga sp. HBU67558]MBQ0820706.1 hypothetical protein [Microvirga sp. HBU67558]